MENDPENTLIDAVYDMAVNSTDFDEMLRIWEFEVLQLTEEYADDNQYNLESSQKLTQTVESHFNRAFDILDKMRDTGADDLNLEHYVNNSSLPIIILSTQGQVHMASQSAHSQLGVNLATHFSNIEFASDDIPKIKQLLDNIDTIKLDNVKAIIRIQRTDIGKLLVLTVSKIIDPKTGVQFLCLSGIMNQWDDEIGTTIQQTFKLTNTEIYIAKSLFLGARLTDIASTRNRSIETIRSQLKSLYTKVNINTQSELIQLFSILQSFEYEEKTPHPSPNGQPKSLNILVQQHNYITRDDGRKFYYEIHGAAYGKPALFLHGVVTGTKLSQKMLDFLIQENIKLICPHRAGFGNSDMNPSKDKLNNFTDDIRHLLHHEQISKCTVIGHKSGAYYAYHLAKSIPDSFGKVRVINGVLPFKGAQQIKRLPPIYRLVVYTSRYTPKLLPFMIRAGIAKIEIKGIDSLAQTLINGDDVCLWTQDDHELFEIYKSGLLACITHGVESYVNDALLVYNGGWEDLIYNCPIPIEVFHSALNPIATSAHASEFFKHCDHAKITILDTDTSMIYHMPEKLLKNL